MKKRIEIRQDWKRGFGSAPTGIKNRVKWSLVGFVVYVAVRFVCASLGGMLSEYHAKNKDEKSEQAKGKESGKDAPHGTDEENHYRQNCQHGQPTAPKGRHTTDKA